MILQNQERQNLCSENSSPDLIGPVHQQNRLAAPSATLSSISELLCFQGVLFCQNEKLN